MTTIPGRTPGCPGELCEGLRGRVLFSAGPRSLALLIGFFSGPLETSSPCPSRLAHSEKRRPMSTGPIESPASAPSWHGRHKVMAQVVAGRLRSQFPGCHWRPPWWDWRFSMVAPLGRDRISRGPLVNGGLNPPHGESFTERSLKTRVPSDALGSSSDLCEEVAAAGRKAHGVSRLRGRPRFCGRPWLRGRPRLRPRPGGRTTSRRRGAGQTSRDQPRIISRGMRCVWVMDKLDSVSMV
jgi:hypothetical protein